MFSQAKTKTFNEAKTETTEEMYIQGEIYPIGFPDASAMTFLTLPAWIEPWKRIEKVSEILKSNKMSRFMVPRGTFRESGKARNIMRLKMLSPDSVQEDAIEKSGVLDMPQLPTEFPELAGLGQIKYIPELISKLMPKRKRFLRGRRRYPALPPGRIPVEITGFGETPVGTVNTTGQVESTSRGLWGQLENIITKTSDWFFSMERTKYETEQANIQAKLAEAQGKATIATTQAQVMSLLPLGLLAIGAAYLLKRRR